MGPIGCVSPGAPDAQPMPAAVVSTGDVPLILRNGYAYVYVRMNERPAGLWLLDTGSNANVIDTGVATRLGLPITGSGEATGIAGTQGFTRYRAESIAVQGDTGGGVDVRGLDLAGLSMRELHRRPGGPLGGLLGFHALADVPFRIDQASGTLTLGAPAPMDRPAFELAFHHGLPMVHAQVADGRWMWLMLDTGADNHLTLPAFVAEAWPDALAAPHTGPSLSRGVGGLNAGRAGWLKRLTLFGVALRDVPVVFQDEPRSTFRGEPTGRVGNALLRQFDLTFDARQARLWARFQPGG